MTSQRKCGHPIKVSEMRSPAMWGIASEKNHYCAEESFNYQVQTELPLKQLQRPWNNSQLRLFLSLPS